MMWGLFLACGPARAPNPDQPESAKSRLAPTSTPTSPSLFMFGGAKEREGVVKEIGKRGLGNYCVSISTIDFNKMINIDLPYCRCFISRSTDVIAKKYHQILNQYPILTQMVLFKSENKWFNGYPDTGLKPFDKHNEFVQQRASKRRMIAVGEETQVCLSQTNRISN